MPKTTTATDAEQWLDTLDPATTPARDGRALRAIGDALTNLEAAEAQLQAAVDAARAAGDSWAAIGVVLGTSRQAAHRKYSPQQHPSMTKGAPRPGGRGAPGGGARQVIST